jgi:hypothetical protein
MSVVHAIAFIATQLAMILFGLPLAFHPEIRTWGWPARLSVAFLAGAVALTFEAIFLSLIGVKWGERTLALPLLLVSIPLAVRLARRSRDARPKLPPLPSGVLIACAIPMTLALLHLLFSLWFGLTTTTDFVLFWGVKAAIFTQSRGLDVSFLVWPFAIHSHVNYPQLVPITWSWGQFFVGEGMWRFAPLATLLWLTAAIPLVYTLLTKLVERTAALIATTFWTVAMALSLVFAITGGNAEAPLLTYVTVALLALVTEPTAGSVSRHIGAVAIAGALMSKTEGLFCVALLLGGYALAVALFDRRNFRQRIVWFVVIPAAITAIWPLFQIVKGVPLEDAAREPLLVVTFDYVAEIIAGMASNMSAGTFGLSWILAALFLLHGAKRIGRALPAVTLAVGLLAIYFFYYLHSHKDPTELIGWTMSRISQPALSALVLAAAIVTFSGGRDRRERGVVDNQTE